MIAYFLYSSICSALLLVFYRLFFEDEKMHRFKRFYLLLAIIFSYAVPFVVVQTTLLPDTATGQLALAENLIVGNVRANNILGWQWLAICIFLLVSAILTLRLTYNLYRFAMKVKTSTRRNLKGAVLVLDNGGQTPHSFLHYIIVGKDIFDHMDTEKEILHHEMVHVRQGHSYDLLFIEIVRCLLWYNPFLYFYKKSVQLNHEFLADESVINSFRDIPSYQSILLAKISGNRPVGLVSRFNFGMTKKRLVMMRKSTKPGTVCYKQLMVLPLMLFSVYLFGQHVKVGEPTIRKTGTIQNTPTSSTKKENKRSMVTVKRDKRKRRTVTSVEMSTRLSPLDKLSSGLQSSLNSLGPLSSDTVIARK